MLLRADGTQKEVLPHDGRRFGLRQLMNLVGGTIATMHTPTGRLLVVREGAEHLPLNRKASDIMGAPIVGDALLLTHPRFVSLIDHST